MKRSIYYPLGVLAVLVSLFIGNIVAEQESKDWPAYYTAIEATRDGIGKVYMGREISKFVSVHAIGWLERASREGEESPSLVLSQLDLKGDEVIADIGAGSGYFTFLLAPLVPKGKVVAVDIQQEMLNYIKGKCKLKKVGNVDTVLGEIDDTKLPADSIDLVLMVDAYHEFSHPREVMQSILKGLKPGGRVILLEYRAEDPAVPIKPLHKMSIKQVRLEMEAVGLEFVEVRDFLPTQHFLVFRKKS